MLQQQNYPVLSTCKTINDSVHVYNYFKKLYCSFKGGGGRAMALSKYVPELRPGTYCHENFFCICTNSIAGVPY